MQIKENAIFIADAHYNKERQILDYLLSDIEKGKIECSQIFFMGDIFDFLAGQIDYFKKINKEVIEKINKISLDMDVYYLEGNHDYNLKNIFKNVLVIPRQEQPFLMDIDDKTIQLSHGDIFMDKSYEMFCAVIRNKYLLSFLNFFDILNWLSKRVETTLAKKKICHKITDFESLIQDKFDSYTSDIVLEGHYHMGKSYTFESKRYINIPSLFCSKEYIKYENSNFVWKKYEKN